MSKMINAAAPGASRFGDRGSQPNVHACTAFEENTGPFGVSLTASRSSVTISSYRCWLMTRQPYASVATVLTYWRGELDPATGNIIESWEPGRADRLRLLLAWMTEPDRPLLDFPEPRAG
ncbi:hypothetical protein ACFXDD_36635 [Streptomyces anthocyanicus]|uniref:hypothetical protein n=2 Tax=Streptomyces TaxID=1883 RepID=UPI000FE20332|nr:hypothetical protein [Streptomyces sp. 2114.2]